MVSFCKDVDTVRIQGGFTTDQQVKFKEVNRMKKNIG